MTDGTAAIVDAIDDAHPDIRILHLRPAGPSVPWVAGQYMALDFSGLPRRYYSIANAPGGAVMEFHIRAMHPDGVGFHAARTLRPGDPVTLRGPFGHMALPPDDTAPLLLIGGGMGISPLKALAEAARNGGHDAPVTLCWGVRTARDLYLKDLFLAWQDNDPSFRFIPGIEDETGQTIDAVIAARFADLSDMRIYLAGPPAMVAALLPVLMARGARADMIHGDDSALAQHHRRQG